MNNDLVTLNTITEGTSTQSPVSAFGGEQPRRASIWDSFDITKLRNAGEKLNFVEPTIKEGIEDGTIPEANIEIATEAINVALKDNCVEEVEEVTVVKETQPERMDKVHEGQKENDQKEGQWTPVMTRRKGQVKGNKRDSTALIING
ncbi:hypothetical protein RIF29_08337 [Crotalaria pallida]|uniref:Uncharacterized protein n=1 Tax=Crotalaria pallida TaxID=3830 RepID=A0AAN9IJ65_CROPI